jgi:hypothetical protein
MRSRYEDVKGALTEQEAAKLGIQLEGVKRSKFLNDEDLKNAATHAKDIYETGRVHWEKQLKERTSNQEQQVEAINKLYELDVANAKAHFDEIDQNNSTTNAQRLQAQVELNVKLLQLDSKKNEDLGTNEMDWNIRKLEALKKMAQAELEVEARKNQAIFEDTEKSLYERLNALQLYNEAQKQILLKNYEQYQATLKYKNLSKEEQAQEDSNFSKQIQGLDFTNIAKTRDIVSSSANEMIKDLKDLNTQVDTGTEIQERYTESLKQLNQKYIDGKISLQQYNQERLKFEQSQTLALDTDKISKSVQKIKNIQDALNINQTDVQNAALAYSAAPSGDAKTAALQRYNKLKDQGKTDQALLDAAKKDLKNEEAQFIEDQKDYQIKEGVRKEAEAKLKRDALKKF